MGPFPRGVPGWASVEKMQLDVSVVPKWNFLFFGDKGTGIMKDFIKVRLGRDEGEGRSRLGYKVNK